MSATARTLLLTSWALLLLSGLSVVWSRHTTRALFIELQALRSERDALDIQWQQLKIEQSAWATHARVEQTARSVLKMVVPKPEDVRMVQQ
jgi:cell division protein FtsL